MFQNAQSGSLVSFSGGPVHGGRSGETNERAGSGKAARAMPAETEAAENGSERRWNTGMWNTTKLMTDYGMCTMELGVIPQVGRCG